MLRKLSIIGLISSLLFVFPGCFGGDDNATPVDDQELTTYQNNTFSVKIPKEWEIIEPKDFSSRVAENTVVVFRNNVKNDIFTANINILSNPNTSNQNSLENAKAIINSEKANIYNFNEISREEVTLRNGDNEDKSQYIVFEGKNSEEEDTLRYHQVFLSNQETLYIVTGTHKTDEDQKIVDFIAQSLKSFELK